MVYRRSPPTYSARRYERVEKVAAKKAPHRVARTARKAYSKGYRAGVRFIERVLKRNVAGLTSQSLVTARVEYMAKLQDQCKCQFASDATLRRILNKVCVAVSEGVTGTAMEHLITELYDSQKSLSNAIDGKIPLRAVPLSTLKRRSHELVAHMNGSNTHGAALEQVGYNWIAALVLPPSYGLFAEFYEYE